MPRPPSKKLAERLSRVAAVLPILKQTYPHARCSLDFKTPLQLLVATILSAQTTDERVNLVTKGLFKKYNSAKDFAAVPQEKLEKDVHSTGFYRNKARSIRAMAQALIERHDGRVPQTMDELTALAGVGRKTANVVLGNAFRRDEGVVVDTHVARVSLRLGLTKETDPVKIERDLMLLFPREEWTLLAHLLIFHGRRVCHARVPRCEACVLADICPSSRV